MYWNGARMDGSYPLSIVVDGMAMNITLVTYGQNVDFGIIACRRSIPQVQRIIDYMEDALSDLEEAAGLKNAPANSGARAAGKKRARTKTKARVKPKNKPKAKTKTSPKAQRAR